MADPFVRQLMISETFDFLVIGSGLAGLSYALETSRFGKVCVLTKNSITDTNTSWAQGGIAAAVGEADSWQMHEADTLTAGAGLCDPEAVRFLVQNAPKGIEWLQSLGARFDFDSKGDLSLGREGGHGLHRIVHHLDRTGWEVERVITEAVRANPNIIVYEHAFATSLLLEGERCVGAEAIIETLGPKRFQARTTMLATGGCGRLFTHTTNPSVATGDGIALAYDAHAEVKNMEFMQFHPTTLYHTQMRAFLITEAVRGAGGTLRNHLGRRFMYDYDERLELAPRDVVSRAIEAEMKKHDTWCVYLDMTHLPSEQIADEFPTIWERLASIGIQIDREWIPVAPAQHYSCGGVVTDLQGQTSIPGLFAAGEVACTGVHGANRLASNSLLEAMVYSRAAAEVAPDAPKLPTSLNPKIASKTHSVAESESILIRRSLQRTMTRRLGITRTDAGMEDAESETLKLIARYKELPAAPFSSHSLETENLLKVALLVIRQARARKDNIGLHYNLNLGPAIGSLSSN